MARSCSAEQRQFAERHGLVSTDREYADLVSGKDTLRRTDFAPMVADAEAVRSRSSSSMTRAASPAMSRMRGPIGTGSLSDADVAQVLRAMHGTTPAPTVPDPAALAEARTHLQDRLASGTIAIEAFSREWRRLERPTAAEPMPPDELRLRRARNLLTEFGTLWRNPSVPDQLREEALREILGRVDVHGSEIVAVHPAPNDNAWLPGLVAIREERLTTQREVGLVGARGVRAKISMAP